ncbi:MAG: XdhC family protein [Chloroflexi bacterium]|nr:XdhC family protein [Chloroflexota bacterium]MBT5475926.1 XdhC family protein [Chloroflexota bacterium]
MEQVFRAASDEITAGNDMVVATVVKTSGSTPQKPGAKLLVRADGSGVGTLGGGCVEGDIWFASSQLLSNGGVAEMRDYELNEDLAAEDGLVCGGTMYFLLDPLRKSDSSNADKDFNEEVIAAYEGGAPVAVASLMKTPDGSTLTVGAKLLIRENGSTSGSLGDEKLDSNAINNARNLMAMGKNDYITSESGTEYFVEAYTTPPTLVLAGGGHVSKAISSIAASLGFRIFIIDDREDFSNPTRFPEAEQTVVSDYGSAFKKLPIGTNSFIVIATRGHRYDASATAAAMKTPASYVGLLGSKRKTILIFEELFFEGFTMEEVQSVRSPIGLNISARTPEEIALSIMAEIVGFRLGGDGGTLKLNQLLIDKAAEKADSRPENAPTPEAAVGAD